MLKTDLPQIFHGLVVHFKITFCSLVYKCYLWEDSQIKYSQILRKNFILSQFLVNNLNMLYFLKKRASKIF